MAEETNISEQITIEDTPEFRLEDIAGEYRIITRRIKNEVHSKINTYETKVILSGNGVIRPELLFSEKYYKLDIAVENHYSQLEELTKMSVAA